MVEMMNREEEEGEEEEGEGEEGEEGEGEEGEERERVTVRVMNRRKRQRSWLTFSNFSTLASGSCTSSDAPILLSLPSLIQV